MLITKQPVLKRFWYPVIPVSSLQAGPQAFTLMGEPLVLWLDGAEIAEAADPSFRLIHEFYETWNASGLRIMENSFDSAHGHFVHATSWGDESNPLPPPIDEIVETETGFVMKQSSPGGFVKGAWRS